MGIEFEEDFKPYIKIKCGEQEIEVKLFKHIFKNFNFRIKI